MASAEDAHAKPQLKPTIKWVVNHAFNGWLTYKQNKTILKRREASYASRFPPLKVNLTSKSFSGSLFVENFTKVLKHDSA